MPRDSHGAACWGKVPNPLCERTVNPCGCASCRRFIIPKIEEELQIRLALGKPENLPCKDSVAFAGEIYVLSYAGKKEVSAFTKEYLKVKNSGQLTPPNPSDIHTPLLPYARKG